MKKLLIFVVCLCTIPGLALATTHIKKASTSGISTASDCSTYTGLGQLCQDTDDGKLYKGTGAGIQEIAAGSTTDAAADGATKGIAAFSSNDFNCTSGVCSIDYANGQAAASGVKGFLTAADWATFNGKLGAVTGTQLDNVWSSNGILTRTGAGLYSVAGYSNVVSLFGSGTCSGYLKSDGTCDTPSGSIGGSTGSTDNAILRANGTEGGTVQPSTVTIDDSGNVNLPSGACLQINGTSVVCAGSDGSYRMTLLNNTSISPTASAYEFYFDGGILKINENGTERSRVAAPTAGPVTISGPTAARTWTADDAALTIAARDRDNTFTGANTIGDGGDDQRVLMRVNTNDGTWSGITMNLTCHETIAFGQLVFVNSDGEAALADADAAATMPAVAIAVVGGNAAATCTVLTHGTITETDWAWTAGQRLYVSETAGSIENTLSNISDTNDVVQIVGVALSGDTILFNPSLAEVVLE